MQRLIMDLLGWLGAAALLLAYGLVSSRRVRGDSLAYQVPNVVGSLLLVVNTLYYGAYPSSFVNVLWIAIALYTLARRRAD